PLSLKDLEREKHEVGIYRGAAVRNYDALLDSCTQRFPDLSGRGRRALAEFSVTYADQIRRNNQLTAAIFQKEGRNLSMRAEYFLAIRKNMAKQASGFSKHQCINTVVGFEAMTLARSPSIF